MSKKISRKSLASMVGRAPYAFDGMTVRPLFGAIYLVKYDSFWSIDKSTKKRWNVDRYLRIRAYGCRGKRCD